MPLKYLTLGIVLLLLAAPLTAQDTDVPLSEPISYDDEVADKLTAQAFWDWWFIQAAQGDEIVVDMQAHDQLEPLLGLLDPKGTLLSRSEDGIAGGAVRLDYTIPEAGEYAIVATRVGNENGTSTGSYDLRVRRANPVTTRVNTYQEVTFRCQDYEAVNAATLQFEEDVDQADYYLISVYGLDDFEPVIRVQLPDVNADDCSRDVQAVNGNRYALPGEAPITLSDPADYGSHAAQLIINTGGKVGNVNLTIGSASGAPGRYIAVVEGFFISEGDHDSIRVGQGPLAATQPLTLYMIGESASRIDPAMTSLDDTTDVAICDDAGRRDCSGVPSPDGLSIHLADADITVAADRFDAGLVLPPGPPQLRQFDLSSFRENTTGHYALVLLGELPPRS